MSTAEAMIEAVKNGDAQRVAELLAHDPALAAARTPSGDSAVLLASYFGRHEIAEQLLAAGPELSIHEAVAAGQGQQVVRLVRERPELVNSYSHDGWTPLHLAAFFGHTGIAEALLAAGADIHAQAKNDNGNQPLQAAAAGNHHEIVSLLLIAGADANALAAEGFTALHSAAQNGNAAVVRALLDAGADPSLVTGDRRTARDLAEAAGHTAIVAMLKG
jgi:ankyrin repeat protein